MEKLTSPRKRHYGSQSVCRVSEAHGKDYFAYGKVFAVCNTRQSAHDIQTSVKSHFAVCSFSDTRQRLCRVSELTLGKQFSKKKTSAAAVVAVPATSPPQPRRRPPSPPPRRPARRGGDAARGLAAATARGCPRRTARRGGATARGRAPAAAAPAGRRLPRAPQPAVAGPPPPTGTPAGRHSGLRRRRPRAPLPAAVRGRDAASRDEAPRPEDQG